jgi:HrpA-like RNA helicase
MTTVEFPKELKELPVSKAIRDGRIHLNENMVLVAHTGSGKTMSIPPCVALTQGKKVILRQPTRQTCKSTYLGLSQFWGNKLKIGMHTSEEEHGSVEESDIMVVTDGVLKNWLKEPKHDYCVIFDEYHSQLPVTEVEAGIVKTYLGAGGKFQIILLSATIDPANIVRYFETLNPDPVSVQEINSICQTMTEHGEKVNTLPQNQWLKVRYSEGVAYPIENRIEKFRMDTPEHPGSVFSFCEMLLKEKKRGLVFACTRNEIQDLCCDVKKKYPTLPAEFAHADIPIDQIIKFVKEHEPSIVFATVALATSITLPFDEVLIIDKGIDSIWENGIEKQVTNIPLENNGVLQRRGRVGRVKPGICTLASAYRESWDKIKPEAVIPPLSKVSPDHVVMVCAQYEVDARGIDILSDLPPADIEHSVKRLKWLNLIFEDEENNTLKLTVLGKRVNALPLDIDIGVMVAQCPDEILPAVVSIAAFDKGVFNLFKSKIVMIDGTEAKGSALFDQNLVNSKSMLLTKVNILREAFKARSEENEDETLTGWADANGMWAEKLRKVMFKFYQICTKGLSKSENKMRERLKTFNTEEHADAIIIYFRSLKVFEEMEFCYDEYRGDGGWKGEYRGYFCILDGMDAEFLKLGERGINDFTCLGSAKLIKTKKGTTMAIWSDTTLLPNEE